MSAPLRLRPDFYATGSTDGVYAMTDEGVIRLTGDTIAAWVDGLAPYLDGSCTRAELLAALSAERREFAQQVLDGLEQAGALVDPPVGDDEPTQPLARAWLLGADRETAALAHACRLGGVLTSKAGWPTADDLGEGAEPRRAAAPGVVVLGVLTDERPDELERALRLDDECGALGVPAGCLLTLGGERWLVSPGVPGLDRPRLRSVLLRWRAMVAARPAAPTDVGDSGVPDGWFEVLADQLVQAALLQSRAAPATGGRRSRATTLALVTADGLSSQRHRVLPHPADDVARAGAAEPADLLVRLERLRSLPPLDDDEFSARASRLCDSRVGLLGELDEADLEQMPLHVSQCLVSDPFGLLDKQARGRVVMGAGTDFVAARFQTALRAAARYATLAVEPRHVQDQHGRRMVARGASSIDALGQIRSRLAEAQLPAIDLLDGTVTAAPVRAVFPALAGGGVLVVPAGTAAARSWSAAVREAVLDLLTRKVRHRAREVAGSDASTPPLDVATWDAPATDRLCLELLAAVGSVSATDLSALVGVPAVAVRHGGRTAYGCGHDIPAALHRAVHELTLAFQRGLTAPTGAPPWSSVQGRLPVLDPAGSALLVPAVPVPVLGCTDEELVAALAADGTRPVLLPLDHDPAFVLEMPFVAKVVLLRAH